MKLPVPEVLLPADELGRVHFVGYGPSASTIGANRAGRAAARAVVRQLVGSSEGAVAVA